MLYLVEAVENGGGAEIEKTGLCVPQVIWWFFNVVAETIDTTFCRLNKRITKLLNKSPINSSISSFLPPFFPALPNSNINNQKRIPDFLLILKFHKIFHKIPINFLQMQITQILIFIITNNIFNFQCRIF